MSGFLPHMDNMKYSLFLQKGGWDGYVSSIVLQEWKDTCETWHFTCNYLKECSILQAHVRDKITHYFIRRIQRSSIFLNLTEKPYYLLVWKGLGTPNGANLEGLTPTLDCKRDKTLPFTLGITMERSIIHTIAYVKYTLSRGTIGRTDPSFLYFI